MMFKLSTKLTNLPPYLFVEIDKAKRKARAQGRDIIDLGIGDPDQPTPQHIIDALNFASGEPANHRYALDQGLPVLRKAIVRWYQGRFGVALDPDSEVLPLIGSKEGIAHFPLAFINPGDYALVPDPCYPPYKGGVILSGGRPHCMPLLEQNAFLPDLKKIPSGVLRRAKIIYVNYPNNPTSAVADAPFFRSLIAFAKKHKLIIISDLAYSEMAYDGYKPMSILELSGSRDVAIEFHSFSKTYNMTGWRVGWACGNHQLIAALGLVKSNVDSGIFSAVQHAAVAALDGPQDHIQRMCRMYEERRNILVAGLAGLGLALRMPRATFYVWFKVPKPYTSIRFAGMLLEKANIVATPGVGFGTHGEGYVRLALTVSAERITEALARLKKIL